MSDSEVSSHNSSIHSPVPEGRDSPSEHGSVVADEHEGSIHSGDNASIKSPSASPHSDEKEVIGEANGREDGSDDGKQSENEKDGSEKGEVGDAAEVQSVGDKDDTADEPHDEVDQSKDLGDNSDNEEDEAGPSKRRRVVMSSDDEDDGASSHRDTGDGSKEDQAGQVGELITNIFGEESDDDNEHQESNKVAKNQDEDEDEPRFIREEDDGNYGKVWDFDEMISAKKAERKQQKRRRKDGSIDIGNNADEQIRMLTEAMKAAAKDDRHSNMQRQPALQKRKMLRYVKAMLIKRDYMEAIIDDGMLSAVSEWLAPLPDKSLPALEIRTDILKILQDYTRLEQGTLKQCGLGRAVMLLYKHPKETKENKRLAHNLISEWARPIFQLETDYHSMSKEERMQRDYAQINESKRQQQQDNTDEEKEPEPRVYDKGFINRARVPRPSTKEYIIRPKSNVEGQFRGATKNRQNSRYEKTQRDFKERTKKSGAQRAIGVSIEGRRMDF